MQVETQIATTTLQPDFCKWRDNKTEIAQDAG
jgi:hypothetical protein